MINTDPKNTKQILNTPFSSRTCWHTHPHSDMWLLLQRLLQICTIRWEACIKKTFVSELYILFIILIMQSSLFASDGYQLQIFLARFDVLFQSKWGCKRWHSELGDTKDTVSHLIYPLTLVPIYCTNVNGRKRKNKTTIFSNEMIFLTRNWFDLEEVIQCHRKCNYSVHLML